jgi:hypothetical protein
MVPKITASPLKKKAVITGHGANNWSQLTKTNKALFADHGASD